MLQETRLSVWFMRRMIPPEKKELGVKTPTQSSFYRRKFSSRHTVRDIHFSVFRYHLWPGGNNGLPSHINWRGSRPGEASLEAGVLEAAVLTQVVLVVVGDPCCWCGGSLRPSKRLRIGVVGVMFGGQVHSRPIASLQNERLPSINRRCWKECLD